MSKKNDDADQRIDLEEIREFYDEVYYSDASASGASRIPKHYFRLFKRLEIGRGANVLDVACGTGEWLEACAGENCSVSGVDLSAKATAICRERLPQGEFFAQPAETLPFDDDSFDVVTCLGSLEHFVDPEQLEGDGAGGQGRRQDRHPRTQQRLFNPQAGPVRRNLPGRRQRGCAGS